MNNQITYADKVAVNQNSSIPDINKVNASDMNEIKSKHNGVMDGSIPMGNIVVDSVRSKNMFNRNTLVGSLNNAGRFILTETGIRAITTTTATNQWGYFKLSNKLLGKTCTFSCNVSVSSTNEQSIRIYYGNENDKFLVNAGFDLTGTGNQQITNTFLSALPQNCTGIYCLVYANRTGTGFSAGAYVDYNNLMLEEGTTKTSYSPYQELDTSDTGWINLDLLNGVTARSGDQYTPQYRRIGNVVYLKGQINIPQHTGTLMMFGLPVGFRPICETRLPLIRIHINTWLDITGACYVSESPSLTNLSIDWCFLVN